jgi:hypothetical protein
VRRFALAVLRRYGGKSNFRFVDTDKSVAWRKTLDKGNTAQHWQTCEFTVEGVS